MADCTGPGPAAEAGIRAGDVIVKVGDTSVSTFDEARTALQEASGPTPVVYERDGRTRPARSSTSPERSGSPARVTSRPPSAPSVSPPRSSGRRSTTRCRRCPATFAFTGDLAVELAKSLAKIPTKIGALVHSIGGGERDPETPISVVGASIIGGDTVDAGLWVAFWFFLAQLNFVLGAINLVPLLPFDGGHIAIAWFEKIRNMIRSARGKVAAAPVNYLKLMPATYVDPVRSWSATCC